MEIHRPLLESSFFKFIVISEHNQPHQYYRHQIISQAMKVADMSQLESSIELNAQSTQKMLPELGVSKSPTALLSTTKKNSKVRNKRVHWHPDVVDNEHKRKPKRLAILLPWPGATDE